MTLSPLAPARTGFLSLAEHAAASWYRGEQSGAAIALYLVAFTTFWGAYQIISNGPLGLHADLTEFYAWSRHLAAGYEKHPPLGAAITRAWFTLFPAQDWAFHLLAVTYAALALLTIHMIARRALPPEQRLVAMLLLLLTPFYQFLSGRFSANQTLLLAWPLATYCFLRAFETRAILWSIAAGATAALAMLGKYYSVYLIGSFVLAALVHPARLSYLKSPSPWVSAATGLLLLTPHISWLIADGFQPFKYALAVHAAPSYWMVLSKTAEYLTGAAAYVSVLVAVWWLAVRPDRALLRAVAWPNDPDRRMLVVLLAGQILLPPLSALLMGVMLTSLWTMEAWFLLPIVLLSAPGGQIPPRAAHMLALGVFAFTLAALFVAPAVAWVQIVRGTKEGREYFPTVARALEREWQAGIGTPLRLVTGDADLAFAAGFYARSHPDAVPDFSLRAAPWVSAGDYALRGFAAVCRETERGCIEAAESMTRTTPNIRQGDVIVTPRYLGTAGMRRRFLFWLVPPHAAAPDAGVSPSTRSVPGES